MPEKPRHTQAGRLIAVGLVVPCLLICIPPILAYRAQRQLANSFQGVSHALEIERELKSLHSLLVDAETGQHGFLLTSRNYYLAPYQSAVDQIPRQISMLRKLTAGNPIQREHLRQLDPLVTDKLNFLAETISLQQRGNHEAALARVSTDHGKQTMDAIRARLGLMEQQESRLLATREAELASRARFSTGLLSTLVALNFLFAVLMFVMFRRLSKIQGLARMCAWSRTIEYQGEWLSFEQYLLRRFNFNTSHGISPAESEKAFEHLQHK